MTSPLAGKKARVLYRNPDGSTVLHVEDEHDEILVTVEEDGTMFEERWAGVVGVREAWEAASPHFNAMQVPNDAGRKVWIHLEPEPKPEPVTPALAKAEPEPESTAPVSVSRDPQYEPYKPPRKSELARRLAWGPGWDL